MKMRAVSVLLVSAAIALRASSAVCEDAPAPKRVLVVNLEEAIQYAIAHNYDYLYRLAEIDEAKAFVGQATSSALPSAKFLGHYQKYDDYPTAPWDENYDYTLTASQLIWAWGRVMNEIKSARLNASATVERAAQMKQSVRLTVEEAFYNVLLTNELIRIQTETLDLTYEQLNVAKARYKKGEKSNYDVLRQEVDVANVQLRLIRARHAYLRAKNRLKSIMGLDINSEIDVVGKFEEIMMSPDIDEAIKTALKDRPEMREIADLEKKKETDIYATWVQYLPQLSAGIDNPNAKRQFGFGGTRRDNWDDYWIAGVTVSMPIFDGFLIKSKAEQEHARLKQIRVKKDSIVQDIKLDVFNALLDIQAAKEAVDSQSKNVAMAEEGYKIMIQRYALGKATQLDLLDAQATLTQAKVDYVQSVFDEIVARAKYRKAIGEYSK